MPVGDKVKGFGEVQLQHEARDVVLFCIVEHVKGVSCDIANVSVWEVGFLPVIYYPIEGWFKSFCEVARYYFVDG